MLGSAGKSYSPSASITTRSLAYVVIGTGALLTAGALVYLWRVPEKTIGEQRRILSTYDPPPLSEEAAKIKEERIEYQDDSKAPVKIHRDAEFDFVKGTEPRTRYFLRYSSPELSLERRTCSPTILYFPGNAFISPEKYSAYVCRGLVKRRPDIQVIMINPRLAPEFPFPIPHDDVEEMVQYLLNNAATFNIDLRDIMLAGYSSGGNFALNQAFALMNNPAVTLQRLILISPFLNFNLSEWAMFTANLLDPNSLARGFVREFVEAYSGSHPRDDIRLSPILRSDADLAKLPSTTVITGASDYVAEDCKRFVVRLGKNGIFQTIDNSVGNVGHGALWRMSGGVLGMMAGAISDKAPTPRSSASGSEDDEAHRSGGAARRVTDNGSPWRHKPGVSKSAPLDDAPSSFSR